MDVEGGVCGCQGEGGVNRANVSWCDVYCDDPPALPNERTSLHCTGDYVQCTSLFIRTCKERWQAVCPTGGWIRLCLHC